MDTQKSVVKTSGAADASALSNSLGNGQSSRYAQTKIMRYDFPKDFIFGSATSAYQVEGAWNTDGKGQSNWDVFTQKTPGKIEDGANGCVAIDQYNLWKEDVALLKKVGLDSYRFSIAWSRVLPGGTLSTGINKEGIKYYSDLIDLLLAQGIEPCVTLFHWDTPQCLEDEYGGFLSPRIVKDFCEFAELCFWEFGDRVKHWVTLNEPLSYTYQGYVLGTFPPSRGQTSTEPIKDNIPLHRCNLGVISPCSSGDPSTEPYIVAHNLIISHATAVDIYKQKYQAYQGGKIGITNVAQWFEPLTDTAADKEAVLRGLEFSIGWFIAPVVTGDYPQVMRQIVGDRLPKFTPEQIKLVKGSYDFLGINYYTSHYASSPTNPSTTLSYQNDLNITVSNVRDGKPIGPKGGSDWLYIVPYGIYNLLMHVKETYNNPTIYITENGVDEVNDTSLTLSEARFDETRIKYHQDHLFYIKKAIDDGVDLKAYYIWSMFDNFEWGAGYSSRFGLFYVDFRDGKFTRFPKASAVWLASFLNKKRLTLKRRVEVEDNEEYGSLKRLRNNEI